MVALESLPDSGSKLEKLFADIVRRIVLTHSDPGFGERFDRFVEPLTPTAVHTFGTDPGNSIQNATQLAAEFFPLEGEFEYIPGQFEPDGVTPMLLHKGGAGPTTINAEPQNYRRSFFDSPNHVFEPDGLRLQATADVDNPKVSSYLRGQIKTDGGGVWANAFNASPMVFTKIADIGITAAQLALVEVGDMATRAGNGWLAVGAIDGTEGDEGIAFIGLTGGWANPYKGNWHITFTKFQFALIVAPSTMANANPVSTFRFARIPSEVKVGSTCRVWSQGLDFVNTSGAVVKEISGFNITFDKPVGGRDLDVFKGAGLVFLPGVWSGQIWKRKPQGVRGRKKKAIWAVETEVTLPWQPDRLIPNGFTKADVDKIFADNPDMIWGSWFADWTYNARTPDAGIGQIDDPTLRNSWAENDRFEQFNRLGQGSTVATFNNHDVAYTSEMNEGQTLDPYYAAEKAAAIAANPTLSALNSVVSGGSLIGPQLVNAIFPDRYLTRDGSRWLTSAPNAKVRTPNSSLLMLGRGISTLTQIVPAGLSILNRIDMISASGKTVTVKVTSKAYQLASNGVEPVPQTKRLYPGLDIIIGNAVEPQYNGTFRIEAIASSTDTSSQETIGGRVFNVVTNVTVFSYQAATAPASSPATSANTAQGLTCTFIAPRSVATGRRFKIQTGVNRGKIFNALDNIIYRIDDWTAENDFPDQHGLNLALGSFNGGQPATLFFPQRLSDILRAYAIVHSIRYWER